MDFLRRLFGGGKDQPPADANGLYFYVRPKRCDEILRVRIDLRNDLAEEDNGGYFVRKVVRATRCPFPAELHINFDSNRRITQIGVQDGETVEEADYQAWLADRQSPSNT